MTGRQHGDRPTGRHEQADLHTEPPLTMRGLQSSTRWIVPAAAATVLALAILVVFDWLPWDQAITEWIADHRTPALDDFWRSVTHLGDEIVAWVVVACCVALAWPRCRPLAIAIVVLALARPLLVIVLKELIDRERPLADLAISQPAGPSFPSGHPFAAAASLGFVPLVVALYTRRRWVWWASVGIAWSLILLVGASRVYLGAHFISDVIATLLLAVVFIAAAELLIEWLHGRSSGVAKKCRPPGQPEPVSRVTGGRPARGS